MKEQKKLGRPTEEIKNHEIKVRVSDRLYKRLRAYAESKGQSTAETIREALEKML